jgi:hypothetical protein
MFSGFQDGGMFSGFQDGGIRVQVFRMEDVFRVFRMEGLGFRVGYKGLRD